MKKTVFTIFLLVGCIIFSNAQSNLNDYKYVIVPNKYEFLKEADKYQLNSLTKFLFNKYGFMAIMEDESLTDELLKNKCLALTSNVISNSGLFKTKLTVELKNCKQEVIFTTQVGETREKDFAKAFNFALRGAFKSFQDVNYSYQPNVEKTALASDDNASEQEEVEKLKAEIEALKKEKEIQVKEEAKPIVEKEVQVVEEEVEPVVEEKVEPVAEEKVEVKFKKVVEKRIHVQTEASSDVLYAQPIENGFQLVDSFPKVVYKIKRSSTKDMYFVEGTQAVIYKSDSDWILEYYENNVLKTKTLNIKF
jgi:hypothetical protein